MENSKKRVAIYCRTSKVEQNISTQELTLINYVRQKDWNYEIFKEQESTRKTRPTKQALLARLRKGEFDTVVIYRLDRWARSSRELILEISELLSKGLEFYSYSENLDFSTASGKLHFTILSAFAEFEA